MSISNAFSTCLRGTQSNVYPEGEDNVPKTCTSVKGDSPGQDRIKDQEQRQQTTRKEEGLGRPSTVRPHLISLHATLTRFLAEPLATHLGPPLQPDVTPCNSVQAKEVWEGVIGNFQLENHLPGQVYSPDRLPVGWKMVIGWPSSTGGAGNPEWQCGQEPIGRPGLLGYCSEEKARCCI